MKFKKPIIVFDFDGNAEHLLHQIENFEPWQNKVGDTDD